MFFIHSLTMETCSSWLLVVSVRLLVRSLLTILTRAALAGERDTWRWIQRDGFVLSPWTHQSVLQRTFKEQFTQKLNFGLHLLNRKLFQICINLPMNTIVGKIVEEDILKESKHFWGDD